MRANFISPLNRLTTGLFFILFSVSQLACADTHPSSNPPLITVQGKGEVQAKPNEAEFSLSFSDTSMKLEMARKTVDKHVDSILKVIEQFDLDTSSVDSSQITIQPRYDYQQNGHRNFLGYQVNRRVSFTLVNLEQMDKLVKAISKEQIAQLDHIGFTHSNPEKLEQEALDLAIQNSRHLAAHIADNYGVELGKVFQVNYHAQHAGPAPRMMAMSAEMARDSGSNYQQKDLTFNAVVDASFLIK